VSRVFLGIGSNVDVEHNVRAGIRALREAFGEVELSPFYRTSAVGFSGDDFINLVAGIDTPMRPLELKEFLNALEDRHGRVRDLPKFSDRTLDIDILLYDDLRLETPGLVLPRPEIIEFAHVLKPLSDLAPNLRHPLTGSTLAQLWQDYAGDRTGLTVVDFPL
jgi:2-amino-4-hydroxy-6-hydroxymethyldihydropteridine diphosphokinase